MGNVCERFRGCCGGARAEVDPRSNTQGRAGMPLFAELGEIEGQQGSPSGGSPSGGSPSGGSPSGGSPSGGSPSRGGSLASATVAADAAAARREKRAAAAVAAAAAGAGLPDLKHVSSW